MNGSMMSKRNILLVEGNYRERTSLGEALQNWGYDVTIAQDVREAFLKIKSDAFGLIIANYDLLGREGFQCLKKAKLENEAMELLFISAEASVENAIEAMKTGALDFLIKPVAFEQIKLFAEKAFRLTGSRQPKASPAATKNATSVRAKIVTQNKEMMRLLNLTRQVADSMASILIQGESGTGKELFARFIHENSNRCNGPFVAVNCAALPEALLESELFGHEKGAFTGAVSKKPGKFELADGGTILLDEITEMQLHLQAKLLRVIQEREVDLVGGLKPIPINVRVIATTNRDVKSMVDKGDFRQDLYYRLNIIPVKIPALRHRTDDIVLLAQHFIEKYNAVDGRNVKGLTKEALSCLEQLPFKGNVREMENIMRRAVLLSDGNWINVADLFLEDVSGANVAKSAASADVTEPINFPNDFMGGSLKEVEQRVIYRTLNQTDGNRTHAAKILGISVRTLRNKLNEYKELKGAP